jgi:hypothetical protein
VIISDDSAFRDGCATHVPAFRDHYEPPSLVGVQLAADQLAHETMIVDDHRPGGLSRERMINRFQLLFTAAPLDALVVTPLKFS